MEGDIKAAVRTALAEAGLGMGRMAFSVEAAAAETNLCRDKIYAAIRDGKLKAKKAGRRTLIPADALRQFIDDLPPLKLPLSP
jgi:excisionase family DNA binding protein